MCFNKYNILIVLTFYCTIYILLLLILDVIAFLTSLRSLEAFIRAKYEQKKYIAKEWVPPPAPKPAVSYKFRMIVS